VRTCRLRLLLAAKLPKLSPPVAELQLLVLQQQQQQQQSLLSSLLFISVVVQSAVVGMFESVVAYKR
jgi:hypothetical protein